MLSVCNAFEVEVELEVVICVELYIICRNVVENGMEVVVRFRSHLEIYSAKFS